jgi:hypothetical protein
MSQLVYLKKKTLLELMLLVNCKVHLKKKTLLELMLLVNCKVHLKTTSWPTKLFVMWINEGTNLSTIRNVLKCQTYEKLGIFTPFEGVCFDHAFS